MSEKTFEAKCICGSTMKGSIEPASMVPVIMAVFWQIHTGEGHGPKDE